MNERWLNNGWPMSSRLPSPHTRWIRRALYGLQACVSNVFPPPEESVRSPGRSPDPMDMPPSSSQRLMACPVSSGEGSAIMESTNAHEATPQGRLYDMTAETVLPRMHRFMAAARPCGGTLARRASLNRRPVCPHATRRPIAPPQCRSRRQQSVHSG